MQKAITFANISGIPLKVHLNWFPVAALLVVSYSASYYPHRDSGWVSGAYWFIGSITTILFFGSVLVHEMGHALVAIREGIRVNSITLFMFGGASHIAHEPPSAGSDLRIVAAGPLASLSLGVLFYIVAFAATATPTIREPSLYLGSMNLILAGFNLIPGFPLDGGRIIRAILWKLTSDFYKATHLAILGGYLIASLIVAGGTGISIQGNPSIGLWGVFIGLYLGYITRESSKQAKENVYYPEAAAADGVHTHDLRPRGLYRPARAYGALFIPDIIGREVDPLEADPNAEYPQPHDQL